MISIYNLLVGLTEENFTKSTKSSIADYSQIAGKKNISLFDDIDNTLTGIKPYGGIINVTKRANSTQNSTVDETSLRSPRCSSLSFNFSMKNNNNQVNNNTNNNTNNVAYSNSSNIFNKYEKNLLKPEKIEKIEKTVIFEKDNNEPVNNDIFIPITYKRQTTYDRTSKGNNNNNLNVYMDPVDNLVLGGENSKKNLNSSLNSSSSSKFSGLNRYLNL